MMRQLSVMVVGAVLLVAPVALAEKRQCEAHCDETAKTCEDAMTKKLGKDNHAAMGQVKKICGDAAKHCKDKCK